MFEDGDGKDASDGGSEGTWILQVEDPLENSTTRQIALNGWALTLCGMQEVGGTCLMFGEWSGLGSGCTFFMGLQTRPPITCAPAAVKGDQEPAWDGVTSLPHPGRDHPTYPTPLQAGEAAEAPSQEATTPMMERPLVTASNGPPPPAALQMNVVKSPATRCARDREVRPLGCLRNSTQKTLRDSS